MIQRSRPYRAHRGKYGGRKWAALGYLKNAIVTMAHANDVSGFNNSHAKHGRFIAEYVSMIGLQVIANTNCNYLLINLCVG